MLFYILFTYLCFPFINSQLSPFNGQSLSQTPTLIRATACAHQFSLTHRLHHHHTHPHNHYRHIQQLTDTDESVTPANGHHGIRTHHGVAAGLCTAAELTAKVASTTVTASIAGTITVADIR